MYHVLTRLLQQRQDRETEHDGRQVRPAGPLVTRGQHLEERDVEQRARDQTVEHDGHGARRPVGGGAVARDRRAERDADGRDRGGHGRARDPRQRLEARAKGGRQLVRGHGCEQAPRAVGPDLEPDGHAPEDRVQRENDDRGERAGHGGRTGHGDRAILRAVPPLHLRVVADRTGAQARAAVPAQHRVRRLVSQQRREEPGAQQYVGQVLGVAGQPAVAAQLVRGVPRLGRHEQQRGTQQRAAAEAQQQRRRAA